MKRGALLVSFALLACGRSWVFDDLQAVAESGTSSSSGGHRGTSGGATTGRGSSSGGSTGHGSSGAASSRGTGTGGSATSGGSTGRCSTQDCQGASDCCPFVVTNGCPAGLQGCVFGVCAYEGPACGSSSGGSSGGATSGGSSGGSSSGGSGGTTGSPPGCNPNAPAVEYLSCASPEGCGCPLLCVRDALAGQVCEYPCAQTSDCPDLLTICNGTNCQLNACGPGTGNGSYNSFCNVVGTNDGTCTPLQLANGTVYGVCGQGGSASTACDYAANRQDLAQVCQADFVCIGGAIGQGGVCGQACDPNGGALGCPAGQQCALTVDDPLAGACYTP